MRADGQPSGGGLLIFSLMCMHEYVCVHVYVTLPIYVYLSVHTHLSKPLRGKSSLYTDKQSL